MRYLRAKYPEIAELKKPTTKTCKAAPCIPTSNRSSTCNSIAPPMTGITIIKEKLAAVSLSTPNQRAVVMVDPERLIPGIIAQACARPMAKLFTIPIVAHPPAAAA